MPDLKLAQMLLRLAREDLEVAEVLTREKPVKDSALGFHLQQAAEKALKSWLTLIDVVYPKVHDLEKLLTLLEDSGQNIPRQFWELADLSDFAVRLRYEILDADSPMPDKEATCNNVRGVVGHVERLISKSGSA